MKIEKLMEKEQNSKKLYGNEWLSLRVKDGWFTYVHEEKSDGRGVAIIGFKKDENDDYRFTAHMEPHVTNLKTLRMASITGQMDKENEEAKATAIREMEEEAGIKITEDELIELGMVDTYKQADTVHYLFAVDCSDYDIGESKGDGTIGEENAYSIWVTEDELVNCSDPLIHSLFCRLKNRGHLK